MEAMIERNRTSVVQYGFFWNETQKFLDVEKMIIMRNVRQASTQKAFRPAQRLDLPFSKAF
jgi:hypothetical protein